MYTKEAVLFTNNLFAVGHQRYKNGRSSAPPDMHYMRLIHRVITTFRDNLETVHTLPHPWLACPFSAKILSHLYQNHCTREVRPWSERSVALFVGYRSITAALWSGSWTSRTRSSDAATAASAACCSESPCKA